VRQEVLRDAQRRLNKGVDGKEVIEYATASFMKKLLHNPSVRLREAAEAEDENVIDVTRRLFGIDGE
jgi:glutamyl-tRNA reductase